MDASSPNPPDERLLTPVQFLKRVGPHYAELLERLDLRTVADVLFFFPRDEILNHLQGIDADVFSRSIDIAVSRLRQKLGETRKTQRFIKTVWGTGYVFVGK